MPSYLGCPARPPGDRCSTMRQRPHRQSTESWCCPRVLRLPRGLGLGATAVGLPRQAREAARQTLRRTELTCGYSAHVLLAPDRFASCALWDTAAVQTGPAVADRGS